MRDKFNLNIGFSDHSYGYLAAVSAVSLGACFVEKHFTLNKNLIGPDHHFSSDPNEFTELVKAIRFTENAMGKSSLVPTKNEKYGRKNFRLSCMISKNLKKGHILKDEDIIFSRPGTGLPPKNKKDFLNKKIKRNLKKGKLINFKDII